MKTLALSERECLFVGGNVLEIGTTGHSLSGSASWLTSLSS